MQKKFAQAASQGDVCLRYELQDAECLLLAGEAYSQQKKGEQKAVERYTTFLRLALAHPRTSEIRVTLRRLEASLALQEGSRLFQAKQFEEAFVHATRCIGREPTNAACQLLAGRASVMLKQLARAAGHFRKFVEMDPDHKLAPKIRATLAAYEQQQASAP
jgi:tetratricopeptide (TPR) repeat protein